MTIYTGHTPTLHYQAIVYALTTRVQWRPGHCSGINGDPGLWPLRPLTIEYWPVGLLDCWPLVYMHDHQSRMITPIVQVLQWNCCFVPGPRWRIGLSSHLSRCPSRNVSPQFSRRTSMTRNTVYSVSHTFSIYYTNISIIHHHSTSICAHKDILADYNTWANFPIFKGRHG